MEWIEFDKLNSSDNEIRELIKKKWHVNLPETFISLISQFNKGVPKKQLFITKEKNERIISEFLNFNINSNYSAFEIYDDLRTRLPQKCYPFAKDPFGNFICFQINGENPEIIFWNHEGLFNNENNEIYNIENVASSFDDFLGLLYESQEEVDFDIDDFEILD